MRSSDIVTQLCVLLPQLTDKFTDDVSVESITRSGTNMTVNCHEKHGLEVGHAFAILNTDVPINIGNLNRVGTVGTLVAAAGHDLTSSIASTVTITGPVPGNAFIGTFDIIEIVNRTTITFVMADEGGTVAGGFWLRGAESALKNYNTTYEVVEVISPTQVKFIHPDASLGNPDGDNILLRVKPRITAGVSIERLIEGYTAAELNKYWMFVVLGDPTVSQSRLIESDAISNQHYSDNYRQQMIEPFTVYVAMQVTDEIAARESRDIASDLLRSILRSLLFSRFATGLYANLKNVVQFAGHAVHTYSTAVYVHSYSFEQVAEIYFEDTVGDDLDVAFRNIDFSIFSDFGTQVESLDGTPDLDDTPL